MIFPVDTTVTAGDPLTVQCTMTVIPYLAVQPTVELLGPDGSVLATTNIDLMVDLTLDPVRTSDAGQYTCRASVVIASVSVNVSGQSSSTLTVKSELMYVFIIHVYVWYPHPSVPPPDVTVTLNSTPPLYAGTGLTLTCTVTLDPNVDNGERVVTEWSGPRDISGDRYSVTGTSGSGSSYTDSLTISPLADLDDGTYTCTVTVTGGSNVQQANAIDHNFVTKIRKRILIPMLTSQLFCIVCYLVVYHL